MIYRSTFVKLGFFLGVLSFCASASIAVAEPESGRAHEGGAHAGARAGVHVGVRPPPARLEHVPPARRGYQWTRGYWGWDGRGHVWMEGHWEQERLGFRFNEARWMLVGAEWVFYPGYWDPLPAPVVYAQPPVQVIVQQPPTVYVEQQQAQQPQPQVQQGAPSPAQQNQNFWYYCRNPAGYYPYVKECAGGWQPVTPTPP
jgi:hypothetical protein